VVGPDGIALNVHIAEAIDYAVDHRAAVVNISLIGPNSPPELERAITRARAAGILVVAAAGNEEGGPRFPRRLRARSRLLRRPTTVGAQRSPTTAPG
jgi:subtilisin family serine protease